MAWLTLIRYKNILILWANIWAVYYFLAIPLLEKVRIAPRLSLTSYFLFTLVGAIIMAWGNIRNDIHDVTIDQINRPLDKRIIPDQISVQQASAVASWLCAGGLVLSATLAICKGLYLEWLSYPLALVLLQYYNTRLSRSPFWGNILVALLSGLISVVAMYAVIPCLISCPDTLNLGYQIIIGIGLLCAVASFIREIIKDLEDLSGDEAQGRLTTPIRYGLRFTHRLLAIAAAILILITSGYMYLLNTVLPIWSIVILVLFVIVPMCYLILQVSNNTFNRYQQWSKILKLTLITGIVHLIFITF